MPDQGPIQDYAGEGDALGLQTPDTSRGGELAAEATVTIADLARQWFIEAYGHELWKEYLKESDEDMGFYVGGMAQWSIDGSTEEADQLKQAGRAVLSINNCQSPVDVMIGLERQNRWDPHAKPVGNEDPEDAETFSFVLKYFADLIELAEYHSEQFEDGLIQGMKVIRIGVSTQRTPTGEITLDLKDPGRDVIWDPYWTKYDLSDARYVLDFKWAHVDDVLALYADQKDAIRAAVRILDAGLGGGAATATTDGSGFGGTRGGGGDAYGNTRSHPDERLFYDPGTNRIMVMEVWYLTYRQEWVVLDTLTGQIRPVETDAVADALVEAGGTDPDTGTHLLTKHERQVPEIDMAVVLPATRHVLEEGNPHDNDLEHYPHVPFIAKRKRDHIYGPVRNLKDPQRVENKRIAQAIDIVSRFANIRQWYYEKSLVDPRVLQDQFSTAPLVIKDGGAPPGWLVPPLGEVTRVLTELALQMKMSFREISGINTQMLGLQTSEMSGIAIARQQAQGQVIAGGYFSRFARTRKLSYQRLAKRIQQVLTTERYLRLVDPENLQPILIHVNPPAVRKLDKDAYKRFRTEQLQNDAAGRPRVLRDPSALEFDVVIAETPQTATARTTAALALLDLLGKVPQLWPAVIDIVLELLDIPRRQEILERVRAMQAQPGMPGANGGGTDRTLTGMPPQPTGVNPEVAAALARQGAGGT